MKYWLGVVCREHVERGRRLGIAQLGHGKRPPLARLSTGDWLVYYSPRTRLRDSDPLRAFTALAEVADETIWQADEGDFKPWRRRMHYHATTDTPIADLRHSLDLTADPNWGYQLRRGLIELSEGDFTLIRAAMSGKAMSTGSTMSTVPQEGLFAYDRT
ncbi:EVE domain-containing protein [Streptomyces sp. NPDC020192]|uniref:EVE domain-containing protein n=1 Tax=Streptomyces sp. NPDC020192 TaxID=3365066 RepID=UPI0037B9565F